MQIKVFYFECWIVLCLFTPLLLEKRNVIFVNNSIHFLFSNSYWMPYYAPGMALSILLEYRQKRDTHCFHKAYVLRGGKKAELPLLTCHPTHGAGSSQTLWRHIKMVGRKLCEKGAWMQKGPILCGVVRENTPDEENIWPERIYNADRQSLTLHAYS